MDDEGIESKDNHNSKSNNESKKDKKSSKSNNQTKKNNNISKTNDKVNELPKASSVNEQYDVFLVIHDNDDENEVTALEEKK